ncbi:MAG: hypothetical protein FWD97_10260 [Defluviitaleaceae bacterium]|nr:hypothetical protein [Defluviitaleaceae bacterium]
MDNLISKLKDLFVTNLPLKIGAILIAVVVWFLILNFQDPVRTQELVVRLTLLNEEALARSGNHFFLENAEQLRQQYVTVQVRGNNQHVDALSASLVAYIDLSLSHILDSATTDDSLNVHIGVSGNFGDGVDFRSHSPSSIALYLDTITSREFFVDFQVTGQPAEGYILIEQDSHIRPNVLTMRGPSKLLNQIDRLLLEVDIEGTDASIHRPNQQPIALDIYGELFDNENVRPFGGITVSIPVFRSGTAQILPMTHEGDIGSGFGIGPINVTPAQFEVAGSSDAIETLIPIALPPIALNGATTGFEMEFDISQYLPDGVFLVNADQNIATAQVIIEPIGQREFTVFAENVSFVGSSNFQVLTESITFTVSALESILAGISNVGASASLFGRGEGEHTINLSVGLPLGATIVGETPTITVRIGDLQGGGDYIPPAEDDDEVYPEDEPEEGYYQEYDDYEEIDEDD